jgi:tetratricopeptide (TPR) repeat protein
VIAHLAAWKEREVGNLAAAARGEPPVRYDDFEAVNARDFEAYRDRSWAEILEKAVDANRQLIEQIEGRSETELEGVWHGERRLWQSIVGTGYTHPLMHLGQIYVERGEREYGTKLQEEAAVELLGLDGGKSWEGTVRYNLACHYALVGEAEKAIRGLSEALQLNPGLKDWSKEDPDFASIREEPEYTAIYEE